MAKEVCSNAEIVIISQTTLQQPRDILNPSILQLPIIVIIATTQLLLSMLWECTWVENILVIKTLF